jgi:hypothetical protein
MMKYIGIGKCARRMSPESRVGHGLRVWFFVLVALHGLSAQAPAQEIRGVRVGFPAQVVEEARAHFKVGLWAPVLVDLQAGPDGWPSSELTVETSDSENTATYFPVPVPALGRNETRTVMAYALPGTAEGRFTISLRAGGRDLVPSFTVSQDPLDIRSRLYLSLGGKLPGLQDALVALRRVRTDQTPDVRNSWPRFAAYEADVADLPGMPLGYDAVDLMFLTTGDAKFIQQLASDPERIEAIAGWVRQGGRLVISLAWQNASTISRFINSAGWQPQLPLQFPAQVPDESEGVTRLSGVEEWARITDKPFVQPAGEKMRLARLDKNLEMRREWKVWTQTEDGRPIIVSFPYGRGKITVLAFELSQAPFSLWEGRGQFWKALVSNLEPSIPQATEDVLSSSRAEAPDLITELQVNLDSFEARTIPFGWVAVCILVYILLVGPLDYFFLKKVCKRLEWTWITFPAIVLIVSGIVYFAVAGIKGHDLSVNKIDLVDFDLRSELNEHQQPGHARAFGNTWFTILSPEINNYTVSVQPVLFDRGASKSVTARHLTVSWLGRPENDGPAAMGRPRMQGWSRRGYSFLPEASGLRGVPIPVWTTKAFTASWEADLPTMPLQARLMYHGADKDLWLSGTLQSFLPVDLHDVWLFYRNRCWHIEGGLQGSRDGGPVLKLEFDARSQDIQGWPQRGDSARGRSISKVAFHPIPNLKELLFYERLDSGFNRRNYSCQRLDMSWRLREELTPGPVRDAVLVGTLPRVHGQAHDVLKRALVPTHLQLDHDGGPDGNFLLAQETMIRVFLPVQEAPSTRDIK